jgi:hypothetical protein
VLGSLGLTIGLAIGLAACIPDGVTLTVNVASDGIDADPGDGVCEVTPGAGDCSLRAAIGEANALPKHERIVIAAGVDPTLALAAGDDQNLLGDLDVTDSVTIEAEAGATVDAGGLDRVLQVFGTADDRTWVNLRDVTLRGGAATQAGAIWIGSHATVDLDGVSIVDNHTTGVVGAVRVSAASTLSALNSTLSGNSSAAGSGAVFSLGTVRLTHVTVTDNSGTVGALQRHGSADGPLEVRNSIVADQLAGPDCHGVVTTGGHNLEGAASCSFTALSDLQAEDPELAPLGDNGGPTPTHLPAVTSPAVNFLAPSVGGCGVSGQVDQRNSLRPVGGGCDIGSVEAPLPTPLTLFVDDSGDLDDALPGDGVCDSDAPPSEAGDCTLRAAISESNAWPTVDSVSIGPGIAPVFPTSGAGNEDDNARGDLDITDSVTVDGNGAVVDGNWKDRVFDVRAPNVTLQQMTITDGRLFTGGPLGDGAGVRQRGGHLTVSEVQFVANAAIDRLGGAISTEAGSLVVEDSLLQANTAARGGGINVYKGALTLRDSRLTGNIASGYAGGVHLVESPGELSSSTVDANRALSGSGGGVFTSNMSSVHLRDVTLTDNIATAAGEQLRVVGAASVVFTASTIGDDTDALTAVSSPAGTVTFSGTAVAGACDGTVASLGYNIASTSACNLTKSSDLASVDPQLGPLADNGGPTPTRLPTPGSAAIDSVPVGAAGLCDSSHPMDQRGVGRPVGAACDRGAVEQ